MYSSKSGRHRVSKITFNTSHTQQRGVAVADSLVLNDIGVDKCRESESISPRRSIKYVSISINPVDVHVHKFLNIYISTSQIPRANNIT